MVFCTCDGRVATEGTMRAAEKIDWMRVPAELRGDEEGARLYERVMESVDGGHPWCPWCGTEESTPDDRWGMPSMPLYRTCPPCGGLTFTERMERSPQWGRVWLKLWPVNPFTGEKRSLT